MKNKSVILIMVISILSTSLVYADSPLTSTLFSKAYKDETIIIKASMSKGKLNKDLMIFLAGTSNPVDVKMAVINELGWKFEGKKNATKFMKYLIRNKFYSSETDLLKNGSADDLLCMAYLKGMDNYFEVDDAILYSERALLRKPESYTCQIISALLKAQKVMDSDWCQVYITANIVRENTSFKMDMKEDAMSIIFEYMDIYKEECLGKP